MALIPSAFRTQNALANFSISYANNVDDYAALKIFTPFIVPTSTFKWYVHGKDNQRITSDLAASGTEAPQIDYSVFTNTSTAKEHAYKFLILGKDARDFDRPVADLRQDGAAAVMERLLVNMEDEAHTKATTAANYPSSLTSTLGAGATWAVSGGNPLEDVRLAKQAVYEACNHPANTMALSYKGMEYLRINPEIVDRIKYTNGGPITNQAIAALLGLDEIIVSKAAKNTALQGSADVSASIWDDDALIFYKNPSNALRTMAYGRAFMVQSFYTKMYPEPKLGRDLGADWLESGWEYSLEFASQVSDSDGDSNAGYALLNIF